MIKSIKRFDNTRDPKKLTPEQRRFHDPFDRRLAMTIEFNKDKVPNELANYLIRGLDNGKGVLRLISNRFIYTANFTGITTMGHDLALEKTIEQLPIDQTLEIGTVFNLSITNPSATEAATTGLYAISIMSDNIKCTKELKNPPFNRRMLLGYLMPNETIQATFVVKEAADRISARRRTWFARPEPHILTFETQLNDTPDALMGDIVNRLLEKFDTDPYLTTIYLEDDEKEAMKKTLEELKAKIDTKLKH